MLPSPSENHCDLFILYLTSCTFQSFSAHWPSRADKLELVADVWIILLGVLGSVRIVCAEIEERRLLSGMFSQFSHLVDGAWNSVFLFALTPALGFVSLSLLARMFLLALGKC